MPKFLADQIEFVRITETDADGVVQPGALQYTTCCIDSIEWENDQEDAEDVTIDSANRACQIRYRRPARKFGKLVTLGFRGNVPEAMHILTGAPLNYDEEAEINGEGDTDYECKFVTVEFAAKSISGACQTGSGGRSWRIFFKVGQWAITQDESYTNANEVPVVQLQGYGEKNPNYNDPDGVWDGDPSYYRPTDFTSRAVLNIEVPECTEELVPVGGGESS